MMLLSGCRVAAAIGDEGYKPSLRHVNDIVGVWIGGPKGLDVNAPDGGFIDYRANLPIKGVYEVKEYTLMMLYNYGAEVMQSLTIWGTKTDTDVLRFVFGSPKKMNVEQAVQFSKFCSPVQGPEENQKMATEGLL